MSKHWRVVRFISMAVGIALVVAMVLNVFCYRAALSPAQRKVQSWLKKGYAGQIGGADWAELKSFGADTLPSLIKAATNYSAPAPRLYRKLCARIPPSLLALSPIRDSESERFAAEQAILNFPLKERAALVAALVPLLQDPHLMARTRAAEVLSTRMELADTNWLPSLSVSLDRESNPYLQLRLAMAVGRVCPTAEKASAIVQSALTNSSSLMRSAAKEYLAR